MLSTAAYHQERPDLVCGFVTTNVAAATASSDWVIQDRSAAGLNRPSAFRSYFVTHRQSDVLKVLGRLTDRDWIGVKACVRRALEVL